MQIFANNNISDCAIKSELLSNQQLADELHKSIIRNLSNVNYTNLLKMIYGVQTQLICS